MQLHLQVKFVHQGPRVTVKVTGAKKAFAGGVPSIDRQSCLLSDDINTGHI